MGAVTWKAAAVMLHPPSFLQPLIEQFGGNCATKLPKGESRCSRLITAGEIRRAAPRSRAGGAGSPGAWQPDERALGSLHRDGHSWVQTQVETQAEP